MTRFSTGAGAAIATIAAFAALAGPAAADGFAGPYIGASAYYGAGVMDAKVERFIVPAVVEGSQRQAGPSIAGFAGYDWRLGRGGVFGISTDIALAKFGSSSDGPSVSFGGNTSYVVTLRGRLGHEIGMNSMVYVTGGLAYLKNDLSGRLGGFDYSLTGWVPGWAAGAGFEHRRMWGQHPIRLGLEVMYIDFAPRHFEVPDRRATLEYSGWSVGARLAFELNRTEVLPQPMK